MILDNVTGRRRGLDLGASQSISERPAGWSSRLVIFVLSCGLGLTYAFVVVGPRVLNPFDVSWLVNDPATGYLGWAFFRWETHLTLPLGWSGAIGYPVGEPIAYFDSIPLLATIGWIIRGMLPEDFQYFGLYFVFCCVLQFYFGFRISRRLCGGGRAAGILGGVFFLTAPAFTWRASGHFALISHWVILAALDQFLCGSTRPSSAQIVWRGAICFVAAGINPYITAMTFLVLSGTYLRTLLCQRRCLARSSIGLCVALCSALVGLLLFGFVRGADVSQYSGSSYGIYSMNLLAPIDPEAYGALLLREQPIGAGQYEGYNYLGVGLILTGILALARKPSSLWSLLSIETAPAVAIFVISLLLALSLSAAAGHLTLWHFTLPHPFMAALAALRASGRLFWPGYYLIFIGIIATAFRAFPPRWLPAVLGAALVLQFLDLAPLREFIHHRWHSTVAPLVSSDAAWHDLGRTQRHLVVVPPWQCSFSPGGPSGYAIFGRLALEQHMTINSFYAGRYSDSQIAYFCSEQISQIRSDGLQSNSAYVFNGTMAANVISLALNGKYCRRVDQFILCSDLPGKAGLDRDILRDIVTLRSGDVVPFSGSGQVAENLIDLGWAGAEPFGRWMRGHASTMIFRVAGHPQRAVRIELTVLPFVSPSHPVQRVDVMANGRPLVRQIFSQNADVPLTLDIPAAFIDQDGLVRLDFSLPDATSPASLGLSDDPRELSISVKQLRVEDAGD